MNRHLDPPINADYPQISRGRRTSTVVQIGSARFGDGRFALIAGPCAVESAPQIDAAATLVAKAGAVVLRGGAFKPRTSPYAFQGLGIKGLQMMRRAADRAQLPLVSEVPGVRELDEMRELVDAFQVGARNMQNFPLLKALAKERRPVLLKRGFAATLTEWLLAAEYLAQDGNHQIILVERGIRAIGDELRFTLDLAGTLWAKARTHLPVIIDPSHATGCPELIEPLLKAALAAGLDGAMIEVHPHPAQAHCDGSQALTPPQFTAIVDDLATLALAINRPLSTGTPHHLLQTTVLDSGA